MMNDAPIRYNKAFSRKIQPAGGVLATENHHNQGSPSACCILEIHTPQKKNMRKVEMTHWLKDVFKVFTAKSMGNPGGRAIKGG